MQTLPEALKQICEGQSLVVGSDAGTDLQLSQLGIDARHARFLCRNTALLVQDLDSCGGTFVNDQEVRGLIALQPGDKVTIGPIHFCVPARSPKPSRSPGGSLAL